MKIFLKILEVSPLQNPFFGNLIRNVIFCLQQSVDVCFLKF